MSGSHVKKGTFVNCCIVGWKSQIGKWSRLEETFLGEDVTVKDLSLMYQVNVLPHKSVEGKLEKTTIM
jgi:mannose-1-phosphate guanylyltransferase